MKNNANPLVSIGLPVFNGEKYISHALKSLLSQTYKNIEINISDNASTDKTAIICKTFTRNHPEIKYFRQKKMISPIDNFNFVLSKAKGEYFMWAADDDYWSPSFIGIIINEYLNIDDEKIGLIFPKIIIVGHNGNIQKNKKQPFENHKNKYITFEKFMKESFYLDKPTIIYGIFNKKYLQAIGGYYDKISFSAADIFTLHEFLSIAKARGVKKAIFYKRGYYHHQQTFSNILSRTIKKIPILTENIKPSNLFWFLKNIYTYFIFNQNLIKKYHKKNFMRLTFLNIISSIKLFLIYFPININTLKKTEIYSSRQ